MIVEQPVFPRETRAELKLMFCLIGSPNPLVVRFVTLYILSDGILTDLWIQGFLNAKTEIEPQILRAVRIGRIQVFNQTLLVDDGVNSIKEYVALIDRVGH